MWVDYDTFFLFESVGILGKRWSRLLAGSKSFSVPLATHCYWSSFCVKPGLKMCLVPPPGRVIATLVSSSTAISLEWSCICWGAWIGSEPVTLHSRPVITAQSLIYHCSLTLPALSHVNALSRGSPVNGTQRRRLELHLMKSMCAVDEITFAAKLNRFALRCSQGCAAWTVQKK